MGTCTCCGFDGSPTVAVVDVESGKEQALCKLCECAGESCCKIAATGDTTQRHVQCSQYLLNYFMHILQPPGYEDIWGAPEKK
jgi:hypothetical protein